MTGWHAARQYRTPVDDIACDRWAPGLEVAQVPTDLFAFVLNEPEPNSTCRTVRALCCRIVPFLDQGGSAALRRGPASAPGSALGGPPGAAGVYAIAVQGKVRQAVLLSVGVHGDLCEWHRLTGDNGTCQVK